MDDLTPYLQAFGAGLGAVLAGMVALWLVSLALRDASIVDVFWGPAFLVAAWIYRGFGPAAELRQLLALGLVTVWGVRLAAYIGWRNHGAGEDRRYTAMRKHWGPRFAWVSLVTVFLLQGTLVGVISLPLLVLEVGTVSPGWRWSDLVGLGLWSVGFVFEAVGDLQMARFKADPGNRGEVLDSGLWRLTRHPNYFGDAMVWWGLFFLALGAPGGIWTLPAPALMTLLLLKVSGVTLLEKTITERRPAYREYIERTNAFFPWPPRRSSGAGSGR